MKPSKETRGKNTANELDRQEDAEVDTEYIMENKQNDEIKPQRSSKLTYEMCDYIEGYDTGIIFDSLTERRELSDYRRSFHGALKNKLISRLPELLSDIGIKDARVSAVLNDEEDAFIRISIHNNDYVTLFPRIEICKSGMVYSSLKDINMYTNDLAIGSHSLFATGKSSPYLSVDSLPVAAAILECSMEHFFKHHKYNLNTRKFETDDKIVYAGLSVNNILSRYAVYLMTKYRKFAALGKPHDFELFPKETADALNKLEDWFTYGAGRQSFLNEKEDGSVEEKRPAEFFRDLLDVINGLSFLNDARTMDDVLRNKEKYTLEGLTLLYPLFKDDPSVLSPEESLKEIILITENTGSSPIEGIANVLEGYCDMSGGFINGLYTARIVYALIDEIKREIKKRYKRVSKRSSTGEKGLTIEAHALIVHERIEDGAVTFAERMRLAERAIRDKGFSLLRVSDRVYDSMKEYSLMPYENELTRLSNTYVHCYKGYDHSEWDDRFKEAFKLSAYLKAVDSSFSDMSFDIAELIKTDVQLKEQGIAGCGIISYSSPEALGFSLSSEFEMTSERLELKRRLKEEEISVRKSKYDMIFNFAFAVFGAFGVASSIVSILLSDAVSQAISIGSIMLYLLVVLISYKNSKK